MSLQVMTKHTPHYQTLSVPHSIILLGMVQLPTLIWFYHAIFLPWCQVRHKHSARRLICCLHESSNRVQIQDRQARWHQLIGPQATIIHLLSKEHETRAAIQREANTSLSEVKHHFQFSLASHFKLRTNRETLIEYVCSHWFHMYDPQLHTPSFIAGFLSSRTQTRPQANVFRPLSGNNCSSDC